MGGFFKMSKDAFDELFDNVLEYRLYSLILRNAVFQEEAEVEGIRLKRGQWVRSYRKLAEDLKYKEGRGYKQYSHQAIQKAMKRLEQRGYIKTSIIQLTDKLTGKLTDRLTLIEVMEPLENQEISEVGEGNQLTHQLTDQLTDEATKIKKDKELKEIKKNVADAPVYSSEKTDYNDQIQEVWDHYLKTFDGFFTRLTLTKDRKTKIRARLAEGYTVEDIKRAISNIRQSPFHCGENDNGKFYADIIFICRNGSKLEEWINYQPRKVVHMPPRKNDPAPQPPQHRPNAGAYKRFVFKD